MSVYAFADLHGSYWAWEKIKNIIQPNDIAYFLGDAADRGPDGWRIIKEILQDSRIIYLKGNHEDLMVKAIGHYTKDDWFHWDDNMNLWFYNGGEKTYNSFMEDKSISPEEKIKILHRLAQLPFCAVYNNVKGQKVLLSHAGCDDFEAANMLDEEKFIWDRSHWLFWDDWQGERDEVIVHGHTPIELMIEEQNDNADWLIHSHIDQTIKYPNYKGHGTYWYGKNHKACIDTGAVWNKEAVLLNLDTWEDIIITE